MITAPRSVAPARARVANLVQTRIERALGGRARYRYVKPQVVAEGQGWKIISPCCSRRVDPAGGVIDIAWIEPLEDGYWRLHARDHARARWQPVLEWSRLEPLLDHLRVDPGREFWK